MIISARKPYFVLGRSAGTIAENFIAHLRTIVETLYATLLLGEYPCEKDASR